MCFSVKERKIDHQNFHIFFLAMVRDNMNEMFILNQEIRNYHNSRYPSF